jgi:hypothetical protein
MESMVEEEKSHLSLISTHAHGHLHSYSHIRQKKTNKKKGLFYMCFACMSSVVTCMVGACRGQNRVMDSLKLESSAGSQSAKYYAISDSFVCVCLKTEFLCIAIAGCPGIHSVDQAGFEPRDLPAFITEVLELKVSITNNLDGREF